MTEQVENLVLEYLPAIRADITIIKLDLQDLRLRLAGLETLVANSVSGVLGVHGRLDAMDRRVERIERRLELAP